MGLDHGFVKPRPVGLLLYMYDYSQTHYYNFKLLCMQAAFLMTTESRDFWMSMVFHQLELNSRRETHITGKNMVFLEKKTAKLARHSNYSNQSLICKLLLQWPESDDIMLCVSFDWLSVRRHVISTSVLLAVICATSLLSVNLIKREV